MNRTITTIAATAAGGLVFGLIAGGGTGFATGRATAPTPDACIVALDEGERAIDLTADALDLSADAIYAAATWDVTTLDQITVDVESITAELGDGQTYRDAATECRDGAR